MHKYKLRESNWSDGKKMLRISIENDDHYILGGFLSQEINLRYNFVTPMIDKVLSGKSEYEQYAGDPYALDIYKDKTIIIFFYPPVEGVNDELEIPTIELKEIIEVWVKELTKFKEENGDNAIC